MATKKTKRKLWTNADLLAAFTIFNAEYFSGKLDEPAHLCFRDMGGILGKTSRVRRFRQHRSAEDRFSIFIGRELRGSRRLWATTLLHEMVHMSQRCKYSCTVRGHVFNREMQRLALAGAFNGLW